MEQSLPTVGWKQSNFSVQIVLCWFIFRGRSFWTPTHTLSLSLSLMFVCSFGWRKWIRSNINKVHFGSMLLFCSCYSWGKRSRKRSLLPRSMWLQDGLRRSTHEIVPEFKDVEALLLVVVMKECTTAIWFRTHFSTWKTNGSFVLLCLHIIIVLLICY